MYSEIIGSDTGPSLCYIHYGPDSRYFGFDFCGTPAKFNFPYIYALIFKKSIFQSFYNFKLNIFTF